MMSDKVRGSRLSTTADITNILNHPDEPYTMKLSSAPPKPSLSPSYTNSDEENYEMKDHNLSVDIDQDGNDYFEPLVSPTSPHSPSPMTLPSSKREQCMRRVIQLTFVICVILFLSPLIFFIAGASEIIDEYANASIHSFSAPTSLSDLWGCYQSVPEICANKYACIRYWFFLFYMIVFIIMFACCISLFIIRKEKHPLKFGIFVH